MFEELTTEFVILPSKRNKYKATHLLLQEFIQLRTYNHLINSKSLTENQKKIIKNKYSQKVLLRKIQAQLKLKEFKTQDTYELWHGDGDEDEDNLIQHEFMPEVEKSLLKTLPLDEDKKSDKPIRVKKEKTYVFGGESDESESDSSDESSDNNESDHEDETSDNEEEDESTNGKDINIVRQSRDIINGVGASAGWVRTNIAIKTRGFEVLPVYSGDSNPTPFILNGSMPRQHIENVYKLLHINVLRKKWDIAYDTFCVLLRSAQLDVRSIWPLGIEILSKKDKIESMSIFKQEKFFDWLLSFHIGSKSNFWRFFRSRRSPNKAPMWKSGSKNHSALFVITALWSLMFHKQFVKLIEKLDDMLLQPPFNVDGAFYFVKALCNMAQIRRLVHKYQNIDRMLNIDDEEKEEREDFNYGLDSLNLNSKSSIMNLINEKYKEAIKLLESCEEYNFEYPKDLLHDQLQELIDGVNVKVENNFDDESEEGNSDTEFVTAGSITFNNTNDITEKHDNQESNIEEARNESNNSEEDNKSDQNDFDFDFF